METLESSRVCRLCGKQSGISINIFDKNENHVKKINAVLPIMVHEMDLLPKHMCHRCSYKLEEFHKFYVDCLKTDADLKSQLSWMRKDESKEKIGVPMVHIENVKIKVEPPDYDIYELDPIVENVNYIKSMSSVAFPVNRVQHTSGIHEGITYATYARCGCYCDKKDQSKQRAVTTVDYENAVSKCGKVEGVDTHSDVGNLQAVKKNLLAHEAFQDSRRSCVDSITRDTQRCKSTTSTKLLAPVGIGVDNLVVEGAKVKSPRKREFLSKSTIVRNLRPRKSSVDYVGAKKRQRIIVTPRSNSQNRSKCVEANLSMATRPQFEMPKIKVEKVDDFEGRILRPRKRTIDYIGPKRKYSRSPDKGQSVITSDGYSPKKRKPRRFLSETKLMSTNFFTEDNKLKLAIKQELLSDLEDTVLDESVSLTSCGSKERRKFTINDSRNDNDALPNNVLVNVQNDAMDYNTSNGAQSRSSYRVANTLKSLTSIARNKLKSGRKVGVSRFAPITYSPKYLRSQDLKLRNDKMKYDGIDRSVRTLPKDLRSINECERATRKNLMKPIKKSVNPKKVPAPIKLVDNIKHYCEKCNVSFANKELYKLHACYD